MSYQVNPTGAPGDQGQVTIQVLRRVDGGYLVRLSRYVGDKEISRNYPVEENEGGQREAENLAASIFAYVQAGCPLDALMLGDTEE